MKPQSPMLRKGLHGFTLIELLTVLTIIAILMGVLIPTIMAAMDAARRATAKSDLAQINNAVKTYYTEYSRYPMLTATNTYFGTGASIPNTLSQTNTALLFDVLRNNTGNAATSSTVASLNPRQTIYLTPQMVKNPAAPVGGIVQNSAAANAGCWFDPWGSQYNVLINGNYDYSLPNPYADAPGGTPLPYDVISWAFGRNGKLGGGSAAGAGFSSESGTANNFQKSSDVITWQ